MDLLFGTYRCPPAEPEELGLVEPFPRSYLGQLWQPLWRRKKLRPAEASDVRFTKQQSSTLDRRHEHQIPAVQRH